VSTTPSGADLPPHYKHGRLSRPQSFAGVATVARAAGLDTKNFKVFSDNPYWESGSTALQVWKRPGLKRSRCGRSGKFVRPHKAPDSVRTKLEVIDLLEISSFPPLGTIGFYTFISLRGGIGNAFQDTPSRARARSGISGAPASLCHRQRNRSWNSRADAARSAKGRRLEKITLDVAENRRVGGPSAPLVRRKVSLNSRIRK
jgi:hypothetical protein